jgi:Transketolase, C-terminal domain
MPGRTSRILIVSDWQSARLATGLDLTAPPYVCLSVCPRGGSRAGETVEGYYQPLEKAEIVRSGGDVTILCYSRMRYVVMQAVAELEKAGYDPEVGIWQAIAHPSVCRQAITCPSICLCLSVCRSASPHALCICSLAGCPAVCLSVRQSVCLPVCLPAGDSGAHWDTSRNGHPCARAGD